VATGVELFASPKSLPTGRRLPDPDAGSGPSSCTTVRLSAGRYWILFREMTMAGEDSPGAETRGGRHHPGRRLLVKFVSADSYGLIVLLVVVTYLVSVSLSTSWAQTVVLAIQLATVWLTLRTAKAPRPVRVIAAVAFVVVAVLAVVDVVFVGTSQTLGIAFAVSALLYLVAPFAVILDVGSRRVVDQETVLGAIAAYLIAGMFFAYTYRAIGIIQTTPFFGVDGPGTVSQVLFFSFVTLTTTGYGDLVPATNPGQSLAVMEAVLGQLFLVTAVAKIITAWKPRRWGAADGPE